MSGADPQVSQVDQPRQQYAREDVTNPQDISHPHTTEDETSSSLRERVMNGRSAYIVFAGALVVLALIGYGVLLGGAFLASIASNTYVQAALAAVVVFVSGGIVFAKRERGVIAKTDTLKADFPGGVTEFQGEYVETGDGPAFIPYKGRSGLLRSQKPYTLAELSAELPRLDAKRDSSPDDPAIIELPRAYTSTALTDRGVVVSTLTSGFTDMQYSSTAALRLKLPNMAQKSRLQDANETITELQKDLETVERRLQATENRLDDVISDNKQRREEIMDELKGIYQDLREAERPEYQRQQANGAGPTTNGAAESNVESWASAGDDS